MKCCSASRSCTQQIHSAAQHTCRGGSWLAPAFLKLVGLPLDTVVSCVCSAVHLSPVDVLCSCRYLGLLVFAGYVLFDTQLVVERASAGDMDNIQHVSMQEDGHRAHSDRGANPGLCAGTLVFSYH